MSERIAIPLPSRADRKCAAQHFGAWSIEPKWFKSAIDAVRAGTWVPKADIGDDDDEGDGVGYQITDDGLAIINIDGQMTKRGSSWGGCSTVSVRRALREAADDYMVKAVLLHICSPGGTVSGTADLAADVKNVRDGTYSGKSKPVYAYIADLGCSAAYWVASQCESIWCNVTAVVGSIGTYTVLEDDTGLQEQVGLKYRVVSTGEFKGLGADGAVSDKLIADVQREVNELNAPFLAAVAEGRAGKIPDVIAIADGRAHVGEQAKSLGLVDALSSLDDAIAAISKEIGTMPITREQFDAYAAEHPEAAEPFVEQGYKQAKDDLKPKAATVADLESSFPGQSDFIIAQLKSGATLSDANAAAVKVLTVEKESAAKKLSDAVAAKDAELKTMAEDLKKAQFEAGGRPPVGGKAPVDAKAAESTDFDKIEDPKDRAKAEYAANFNGCKDAFVSESIYVGFRTAELRGGARVFKPGAAA